jgi:hypothetical protein
MLATVLGAVVAGEVCVYLATLADVHPGSAID